jgi:hypothetical protein
LQGHRGARKAHATEARGNYASTVHSELGGIDGLPHHLVTASVIFEHSCSVVVTKLLHALKLPSLYITNGYCIALYNSKTTE